VRSSISDSTTAEWCSLMLIQCCWRRRRSHTVGQLKQVCKHAKRYKISSCQIIGNTKDVSLSHYWMLCVCCKITYKAFKYPDKTWWKSSEMVPFIFCTFLKGWSSCLGNGCRWHFRHKFPSRSSCGF